MGRGKRGNDYGQLFPATCARALFWAWPNSPGSHVWPRPGGSYRCTKVEVFLVPLTCARAVVAVPWRALPGNDWSSHETKTVLAGKESPGKLRPRQALPGERHQDNKPEDKRSGGCRGPARPFPARLFPARPLPARPRTRQDPVPASSGPSKDSASACKQYYRSSAATSPVVYGLSAWLRGTMLAMETLSGADGMASFPIPQKAFSPQDAKVHLRRSI